MVVNRLEEMSVDIMKDYPQLLDGPMVELLTPLDSGKGLTYDAFASVAKVVFEKQLARFTSSIWTRIALIFYLVKEVVYMGQLNDTQLELLVEYATQFVAENSFDSLKKEGGWVSELIYFDFVLKLDSVSHKSECHYNKEENCRLTEIFYCKTGISGTVYLQDSFCS